MIFTARPAVPGDRAEINALLWQSLNLRPDAGVTEENFQRWKYWDPHPSGPQSRSRVLESDGRIVAHGGIWPVLLQGTFGELPAFHLIDWAARREVAGAGMRVLRVCCESMAACFSIGGSQLTRKILPAFGFKPSNAIQFFARPLQMLQI